MKTPEIDELIDRASRNSAEIVEIRRRIHMYPELAYNENRTSDLAAAFLEKIGFTVTRGIAGTGLYADFGSGENVVALRADMDAVAIAEICHENYRSTVANVMHACGHDAHVAIVLGAAKLLSETKLQGKVRIMMQPAEEAADENGHRGSYYMINSGALDGAKALLGLHVDATMPSGKVAIINQPSADFRHGFELLVSAEPGEILDLAELTSRLLSAFYEEKRKGRLQDIDIQILELRCHAEQRQLNINGSFLADSSIVGNVKEALTKVFAAVLAKRKLHLAFDSNESAMMDHANVISTLLQCASEVLGESNAAPVKRRTWTLDFASYAKHVPAAFLLVGAEIKGGRRTQHTASFDIDESSMPVAAAILAETTRRLLSNLSK